MKKILSLVLTLVLIIMIGSVSFAAAGDTVIPDPQVPGAPAENVNDETYVEPPNGIVTVDDESIAGGDSETSAETIEIDEETVPKGDALPKTGGIPAEAFYAAGALIIVAALIISKKKAKAASKN